MLDAQLKDYKIRVIELEDSLSQAMSMLESFTREPETTDRHMALCLPEIPSIQQEEDASSSEEMLLDSELMKTTESCHYVNLDFNSTQRALFASIDDALPIAAEVRIRMVPSETQPLRASCRDLH